MAVSLGSELFGLLVPSCKLLLILLLNVYHIGLKLSYGCLQPYLVVPCHFLEFIEFSGGLNTLLFQLLREALRFSLQRCLLVLEKLEEVFFGRTTTLAALTTLLRVALTVVTAVDLFLERLNLAAHLGHLIFVDAHRFTLEQVKSLRQAHHDVTVE